MMLWRVFNIDVTTLYVLSSGLWSNKRCFRRWRHLYLNIYMPKKTKNVYFDDLQWKLNTLKKRTITIKNLQKLISVNAMIIIILNVLLKIVLLGLLRRKKKPTDQLDLILFINNKDIKLQTKILSEINNKSLPC